MNEHDRSNLAFLLSLSPSAFDAWFKTITVDEMDYALELIHAYRLELAALAASDDADIDVSEAMTYLDRFRIGANPPTV